MYVFRKQFYEESKLSNFGRFTKRCHFEAILRFGTSPYLVNNLRMSGPITKMHKIAIVMYEIVQNFCFYHFLIGAMAESQINSFHSATLSLF